jgi:hypothetical protein
MMYLQMIFMFIPDGLGCVEWAKKYDPVSFGETTGFHGDFHPGNPGLTYCK